MKSIRIHILIPGLIVFLLMGCSQYDEGPSINLIPRKDRVANLWIIEKAVENGTDVTAQFEKYELYLTSDGKAELDAHYTILGQTFEDQTKGTWTFRNNDKEIEFNFEDDTQDDTYQILKLTEKEFWLRQVGGSLELHLREK